MNSSPSTTNGVQDLSATDNHVLQALQAIHNPRSSNEVRQTASQYLEDLKNEHDAPYHGFLLASTKSQLAIVRHFGLSLVEGAVRHRWGAYNAEERAALRDWVIELAREVGEEDPVYLRNKIAEAWVEITKKSWGLEWMDMDALLMHLWNGPAARKSLVLTILDTLSEDTLGHEDATAGLRATDLNRACVDIFTPASVLRHHFPTREESIDVRYGEEGWLPRIVDLVDWCIREEQATGAQPACTTLALNTLRSTIHWILPAALVTARLFERACTWLTIPSVTIQLATIDILLTLFNRSRYSKEDYTALVLPTYRPDTVEIFARLYESTIVDPCNIDDEKYLLSKRFSETLFTAGRLLEEHPRLVTTTCDISNFLSLLVTVLESRSLHVSMTPLHLWTKLLSSNHYGELHAVRTLHARLLEICSQRMFRYEALPENSDHPSVIFLNEDVDTMPERHAFLGNYKRFCAQVVSSIVEQQPSDALYHILSQADQILERVYYGEPPFDSGSYSKTSAPVLRIDAQFSVIEAALKGCTKWLSQATTPENEGEHDVLTSNLQTWVERLLTLRFEDPLIIERMIQMAVVFATGPLKQNAQFAFRVFDYTLITRCPQCSTSPVYDEAVKDLESFRLHQLQRLAMRFADYFIHIVEDIERRVYEVSHNIATDEQTRCRYSSILFTITHRATTVDPFPREQKLEHFLQPLVSQWQDETLSNSLSSFDGFCQLLGLEGIQQYAKSRQIHRIEDWSEQILDDEGKALQSQMKRALDRSPLHATKTLLSVSTEKIEPSSRTYSMACTLWQRNVPLILPNLLRFITQAHAFHDPANWIHLRPEMKAIVRRFLTDRFWQVGISTGSRDEFYAKISETKSTLEGLASSVRATIRAVRETGYRILYYMSLLHEHFYSFEELPRPLADALFSNACALSTHQMSVLVDMIKPIIENCPATCRAHFIPPMLTGLFEKLDSKAGGEWDRIEQRKQAASKDGNLSEEMRDESILRQLTSTSVILIGSLLDPQKPNPPSAQAATNGVPAEQEEHSHPADASMRSYILSTPFVLKPVILFCTHALRMRDTRSCSLIARVLRSIVPDFAGPSDVAVEVREFMSTEVLKACITSLHEEYFVEQQKDLASLIGSIIFTYTPRTDTPRRVLLSLPSMTEEKIDRAVQRIHRAANSPRQQRTSVLNLLEGLRGISVSEQGRIDSADSRRMRSALQEQYVTADMGTQGNERQSPNLEGVAEMFS